MAFEKQGIKPGREGNQPIVNRSTSVFENEKKFRKGKKFKPPETRGETLRKLLKNKIEKEEHKTLPKPKRNLKNITNTEKSFGISLENLKKDYRFIPRKKIKKPRRVPELSGTKTTPKPSRVPGEKKEMIPLRPEEMTPMAKGGRAMYKAGSKGCKLAIKGKGRAYGKNS